MKDSIHVSKENYLKAILEAEAEGRQVIPAMLAHWLEVSAPAVTMALKRLKRDGFVEVGADGIVRLTAAGRETAYHTALRHHLIERMLSEIFGMEWHEIHEEAERLEHAVSPAFEIKLKEKLGVDFPRYVILGACNPPIAHQALQQEINLGLLLPCNVVVYEHDGAVRVGAVDAVKMLSVVGNPAMEGMARQVNEKLRRAVDSVAAQSGS